MAPFVVNELMDALVGWLAEQVIALLGGLLAFLTASVFVSPDVTVLPQVQSIAARSALVVNACFILAIIAAGVTAMIGDSVDTQYRLKQLVPRLVVGFVLSAFAVTVTGVLIEFANALTVSLAGASAPTSEAITFVRDRVELALGGENALLMAVIGLLIVALLFQLVGSWLVRIGMLVVLAGLAPVALACYATPWTQGVADLWWRTLLGCLATPILQAVAFSTGISLLTNSEANLPLLLGLPVSDSLNLLLVIVVLWTTIKIPALIRRLVTHQGRGPNVTGLIVRTVSVQGLTRGLRR